MSGTIGLAEIVGIAGGNERQPQPMSDVDRAFGAALLEVESIVLDLDVEVLAEQPGEPLSQSHRFLELILEDEFAEFARGAAAQTNDPILVCGEKFLVDAWQILIAVEERRCCHLDQVL